MTLFLPKVPVVIGPARPGRGELRPLTLLQVALHSLATLPTVAPSAGSATRTHPAAGGGQSTQLPSAGRDVEVTVMGSKGLNPSPEAGQGLTQSNSSRLHPVPHTGLIWGQEGKQPGADVLAAHAGCAGEQRDRCACIEGLHGHREPPRGTGSPVMMCRGVTAKFSLICA